MKIGLIVDNKIRELRYDGEGMSIGWQEVPDTARVGDVFDSAEASRIDNINTELPRMSEMITVLWDAIISGDNTARDELESRRQAVFAKYPPE